MDNTKLFNLGWRPKISFEEGLANTINWYHAENDRKKLMETL
jgi:nucleoside-diphosphate-sugar epimerase